MPLFLFYLPLLFSPIHLQTTQIYTWQPYNLSLSAPINLTETKDADFWELEDENLDFWLDGERIPFSDEEEEIYNSTSKSGAFYAAKAMGYEKCVDGGPIPNVPDGHYVTLSEDELEVFYILILDRNHQVAYELILEFQPRFKPIAMQLVNSLKFN